MQGLQVRDVREGGVSQTGKPLKRAEVVQGLQVRDVREGGVSQTGKPLKRAEVVYGLQVKGVREVSVSPQPKYSKSAEVVHGLQVRHAKEGRRILVFSPAFFHEMHRATAHNRGIFNAEVVHGLQVRCTKEGGRQPNGKALKKSRDCAWLTDKRYQRRRASPRPLSHSFHIFPRPAIN